MKFKNFDIADVFGPNDTEQAKGYVGKLGYFEDALDDLENTIAYLPEQIYKLVKIKSTDKSTKYVMGACSFKYFLPLEKVKKTEPVETKEKRYRPFVSMRELTESVYGNNWEYNNLTVGDHLWIRRKGDEHCCQNILITSLEYDESEVISMNGKPMQEWLDNFEFLSQRRWRPFGVEIESD